MTLAFTAVHKYHVTEAGKWRLVDSVCLQLGDKFTYFTDDCDFNAVLFGIN